MNTSTTTTSYTPSTAPWPANVHDECRELEHRANGLCKLATACETLGLADMSAYLYDTATALDGVARAIREHNSARLAADLKAAQQGLAAIMQSALAGVTLATAA